jgi:hypothetical protein
MELVSYLNIIMFIQNNCLRHANDNELLYLFIYLFMEN